MIGSEQTMQTTTTHSMSNCNYARIPYQINETESEAKWKSTRMDSEMFNLTEDKNETEILFLCRSLTSILNKLTLENFPKLSTNFKNLPMDTPIKMQNVVNIIHKKAINEGKFRSVYAKACITMKKKRIVDETGSATASFSSFLADRCAKYFDISLNEVVLFEKRKFDINLIECENIKKDMLDECIENETRHNRLCVGNCYFIAELFKFNIISRKMLERLSTSKRSLAVESICAVLITVGEFYEKKFEKLPPLYLSRIESTVLQVQNELPMRIRFMALDLFDLVKNSWHPRIRQLESIEKPFTLQIKTEVLEDLEHVCDDRIFSNEKKQQTMEVNKHTMLTSTTDTEQVTNEGREEQIRKEKQIMLPSTVDLPSVVEERSNKRLNIKNQIGRKRSTAHHHSLKPYLQRNSIFPHIRELLLPHLVNSATTSPINKRSVYPNSRNWN